MALGLANLVQALLLALLLLLPLGSVPAALVPQAAGLPRPGPPGALPAEALLPDGGLGPAAGGAETVRPCAGTVDSALADEDIAGDATPISERRARAVAMTVFSLGTVVGAGFLAVFLIKRLL